MGGDRRGGEGHWIEASTKDKRYSSKYPYRPANKKRIISSWKQISRKFSLFYLVQILIYKNNVFCLIVCDVSILSSCSVYLTICKSIYQFV